MQYQVRIIVVLVIVMVAVSCNGELLPGKLYPVPKGLNDWTFGSISTTPTQANLTVYADTFVSKNGTHYWMLTTSITNEEGHVSMVDSLTLERRGSFGVLYPLNSRSPSTFILTTDVANGKSTLTSSFQIAPNGAISHLSTDQLHQTVFATHFEQTSNPQRDFVYIYPGRNNLHSATILTAKSASFKGGSSHFHELTRPLANSRVTAMDAVYFPEKGFAVVSYAESVNYFAKYHLGNSLPSRPGSNPTRLIKDDYATWAFAPRDDGSTIGVIYTVEDVQSSSTSSLSVSHHQTRFRVVNYRDMKMIGSEMVLDGRCEQYSYDLFYNTNLFVSCSSSKTDSSELYQFLVDDKLGFKLDLKTILPGKSLGLASSGDSLLIPLLITYSDSASYTTSRSLFYIPYTLLT